MAKRGRPRAKVSYEVIQQDVKDGLDIYQIAAKYGVSDDTIRRRLKEGALGISNRSSRMDASGEPAAPSTQASPGEPPATAGTGQADPPVDPFERKLKELGEDINAPWLMSFADDNGNYKYHYNKQTDRYITWMKTHPQKRVVVPGPTHRAILEAYSNMVGEPATINQMCREFGWPRAVMIEYLRIHGMTHDRDPFSTEELLDGDVDDMAGDLVQRKRFGLFQSFEAKKWKQIKDDADKWANLEYNFITPLKDIMKELGTDYRPPLLAIPSAVNPFAVVLGLMDVHVGKGVWELSDGTTLYDMVSTREYVLDCTQRALGRICLKGRPEKIIIPVGSDYFHVDNRQGSTTGGTPQDMAGTPETALRFGCKLMVELVDMCRQVAPVELVFCRGNHDELGSLWLLMFLEAKFEGVVDVTVHTPHGPREYVTYGNTLLGFEHGSDIRWSDLPSVMAGVAREQWGQTCFSAYFTGHLHHEQMREAGGILHFQVPSLSPADRWHDRKAFVLSRQAISAYRIDREEGPCGQETVLARMPGTYGMKMKNIAR